jgi:predicted DNA-binding antitoxin AbrB/MazE fold protein
MTQFTEAVYTNGVLRPTDELVLREAQRVRLIVEALDDDADHGDRPAPAPVGGSKG